MDLAIWVCWALIFCRSNFFKIVINWLAALFGYAILTIVAWIFIWVIQYVIIGGEPFFGHDSIYGVPAKIAEVALLGLLWSDKPYGIFLPSLPALQTKRG